MAKKPDEAQLNELLYQALETEMGGIEVYVTALECALDKDLREEWESYLEETRRHERVLLDVLERLGLDPAKKTPGRSVCSHTAQGLVEAMRLAQGAGNPQAAELVACECVVLAETKDHLNWELIGHAAQHCKGDVREVLEAAHEDVETDEDHHLYHTKGWCRELWLQSLGLPAVLPPPEEVKDVQTAIGASRAEQARDQML